MLLLLSGLSSASAVGALAIGVTGDIAKDGYSLGATVNHDNEASAGRSRQDYCRIEYYQCDTKP